MVIETLFYICFFSALSFILSRKQKRNILSYYIFWCCVLVFIIFWGTRDGSAGGDFQRYQSRFYTLAQMPWSSFFEVVTGEYFFSGLMKFVSSIGGGFYVFYTLIAGISIISISCSLKYSDNLYKVLFGCYLVAIFSYIPLISNIIRQVVAFSLCLLSIKFVFRNDFKRFVIPVIIACGFHTTSLLTILLWFFWNHKENRLVNKKILTIFLLLLFVGIGFSEQILDAVSRVLPFLGRYSSYLQSNNVGENREFFLRCFELIVILVLYRRLAIQDSRTEFFVLLGVLTVFCCAIGFFNTYTKRIGFYFQVPFHMFFYSNIPLCFPRNERKLVLLMEWVYLIIQFVFLYHSLGYNSILF